MAACLTLVSTLRRAHGLLQPVNRVLIGGRTAASAAPLSLSVSQAKLKTGEDLVMVKPLTTLYRMVFKGYMNYLHELQVYEKKLYGPIYKKKMGNYESVTLSSAELLEELLRKDERFPCRGDMTIWTEYRDMRGIGYGPFTEEGEKWYQLRAILNKRMLHPKDSLQYGDVINKVVTDFITRMYFLRQNSASGDMVTDLSNELYRFALEGISSILFETRIGCLEKEIPQATQDFINSIIQMFSYSMMVVIMPRWTRKILPFWDRYIAGWEGIFKFSRMLIDQKMEAVHNRVAQGQEVEGEYLTYLISNTEMNIKEVYGSIAELLLAGVDTTSNTIVWALYLLSQNPEVQDRLYEEVSNGIQEDGVIAAEDITNMPFLKAVIKETLRMYPVVSLNARLMTEKDVSIGGYFFPKKTLFAFSNYSISQDEKVFPEPDKFRPERWLRDGRQRPHPFGSLPFGFGVRGCVGRRIAELEMHLLLSRIISLFEIRPVSGTGKVKAVNRTVLVPDRRMNLHFLERHRISSQ
ncbi:hypothetical protein GJAV_G00258410 [Gymnothorax javanicus]|nr:hypothetical protein GJAV_G00258410 [Gymnothorax javanicus]